MILRASELEREEISPLDHKLGPLMVHRHKLAMNLPEDLRQNEVIEEIAMAIHQAIRHIYRNPIDRYKDLLTSRDVKREMTIAEVFARSEPMQEKVWEEVDIETLTRNLEIQEQTESDVFQQICRALVPLYWESYLLHIIDDLDLHLEEKHEEEEELLKRISGPEELSIPTKDDPNQTMLFEGLI